MKSRWCLLAVLVGSAIIISGCGKKKDSSTLNDSQEEVTQEATQDSALTEDEKKRKYKKPSITQ